LCNLNSEKENGMEKRFLIRGYRENADFPSLCDEEIYSFEEAMNKSREYFKKIRAINKIILFEKEEGPKRARRITLMNNVADPGNIRDLWENT
jgi:hypothetical protein